MNFSAVSFLATDVSGQLKNILYTSWLMWILGALVGLGLLAILVDELKKILHVRQHMVDVGIGDQEFRVSGSEFHEFVEWGGLEEEGSREWSKRYITRGEDGEITGHYTATGRGVD